MYYCKNCKQLCPPIGHQCPQLIRNIQLKRDSIRENGALNKSESLRQLEQLEYANTWSNRVRKTSND